MWKTETRHQGNSCPLAEVVAATKGRESPHLSGGSFQLGSVPAMAANRKHVSEQSLRGERTVRVGLWSRHLESFTRSLK